MLMETITLKLFDDFQTITMKITILMMITMMMILMTSGGSLSSCCRCPHHLLVFHDNDFDDLFDDDDMDHWIMLTAHHGDYFGDYEYDGTDERRIISWVIGDDHDDFCIV